MGVRMITLLLASTLMLPIADVGADDHHPDDVVLVAKKNTKAKRDPCDADKTQPFCSSTRK